ncbi:nucleolar protein [Vermiconidia calcicola]|uniref:Nucleolar protein n=1 Tax=Vermiconidia calcicola TaxID=1690605 RepID=A0ACC3MFT1_9PEZI|nr:nucleolar protein [Vermiconidia calcicola]
MATQTITKKRKSADGITTAVKKVKTAKSADKPAPLKSALKHKKSSKSGVKDTKPRKKDAPPNGDATKSASEDTIIDDNENEEVDDANTDLTPSQTAALLAGFSSSEDEAEGDEDEAGIAIASLPEVPTTGAVQKRIKQAISSSEGDPEKTAGVIYIGRIPHGFHEPQMRAYFSQFGTISHLRLSRNKKTGASQHYAFVEFESGAVADIVAKTMDKYLLFGHLLQVRRVPQEQVGEGMWKGEGRKGRKVRPGNKLAGRALRQGKTREVWERKVGREEQRRAEKAAKLKELGYEFEVPGLKGVGEVSVKPKAIEEPFAAGKEESVAGAEEPVVGDGVAAEDDEDTGSPEIITETEGAVQVEPDIVTETKKTTKKRPASGKTQAKKAVKKVKKT